MTNDEETRAYTRRTRPSVRERAGAEKPDAREAAIDAAMRELYGTQGPDPDIDVAAIRAILGAVYDKGKKAAR